ncbi:hypothetical protein [Xanthobacter autotrophicus]|uniref:hypothetical protein n=1 Tax=Xanthobacter autotrophicus TaxID=280 RepID=UPI003728E01A
MLSENEVLNAYHRTIARHRERTGVSYPLTRANCVDLDSQEIADTNVYEPQVVATFACDAVGRLRIKLV